jgi:hypothetical protein
MLGVVRYITYSFSAVHTFCVLYTALVQPKLELASVAWNYITSMDSSKLETVQKHLLPCAVADFLCSYYTIIMKLF